MVSVLKAATSKPKRITKALAAAGKHAAQQALIQEVQELESRAHAMGLHVAGHALNRAKNALGWEIAGDISEAGKAASALAARS